MTLNGRDIKMKTRQLMGWLTLVGGTLVVLYWSLYFSGAVDLGQADPVVRGFESAFPLADAIFSAVLFSCGFCLLTNRRSGPFLLVVAGAMALYLGALDTTFYGVRGTYYPVTPEGLFQLFLNLLCVGAGALAVWCGWKLWKGTETPRPAQIRDGVIVIVGSASGIGAATARRLAGEGARLVLADINDTALEAQRAQLAAAGYPVTAIPVDAADPDSVDELIDGSLMAFGRIDALVNCAGVVDPGPLDRLSIESVRRLVETNLLGTIHTTRALLPYFRRAAGGHFVHVASLGGIVPMPGEAVYSATKFAVRGFCQSLALELRGTPLTVSVISPDSVDTPQLRAEAEREGSALSFTSEPLDADEVAAAIVGTLRRPRAEVMVPRARGWLARLVGFAPAVLALSYPALARLGLRNRERWRRRLIEREENQRRAGLISEGAW